jgi:phosphoribosylglycinamide formyltransferase-1
MPNIAIFASGEGSNAEQLIRYFKRRNSGIDIKLVMTNREKAGVKSIAGKYSIPAFSFTNEEWQTADEIILSELKKAAIDWIVLAGFLIKVPAYLCRAYPDRIINIHPSLLPKYGGKGFYGMHVHQAVLENKEAETGISIHYVNEAYDEGRMIAQKTCKVNEDDTVQSLKERVQRLEHTYLPQVVENEIMKANGN